MTILEDISIQLSTIHASHHCMHRVGCHELPTQSDVESLLVSAQYLLFPGYFNKPAKDTEMEQAQCLDDLKIFEDRLIQLLVKIQSYDLASSTARKLLQQLPEIASQLVEDLDANFMGDPSTESREEIVYSYPGFKAVTIYRLAHALLVLGVPLLPRLMTEIAHSQTGIDIHPGAIIGRHFFIDHGTGVVIGETCVIGDNVKIYQGVTLGALSFARDASGELVRHVKRHPTIENNVVVYANATILGGNTIVGHNSVVGSSVWLNQSIAPYTIVTLEKPLLRYRGQIGEAVPDFQI